MRKLMILCVACLMGINAMADGSVFTYKATKQLTDQFASLGDVTYHEFDNGIGTVIYSNTVTAIAARAFELCEDLQSINLPEGISTIGTSAFAYSGLQSITIPNGVTTIEEGTFQLCQGLQSINLPASVTTIGKSAFDGCLSLQSITLPAGVTTIGDDAFNGCSSFQSINLPASVTTIGEEAFANCYDLQEVTVAWTEADKIPTIDANVFYYIADPQGPSGATLYVPAGTKARYEAAAVWNTFGTIGTPAEVLEEAKTAAINTLQTATDAAKAAIDNASTYEAAKATQNQYKQTMDNIVSGAVHNINNAASVGRVDEEVMTNMADINYFRAEALTKIADINVLAKAKAEAVAEITTAREGIQNTELNKWIDAAIADIPDMTTIEEVDRIKNQILPAIIFYQDGIEEGKVAGKAELLGTMATPCTDCTVVEVTDGTTTVTLYNATGVDYGKQD